MTANEPLQGWLFKKGEKGLLRTYKKRWFRQVRQQIFYFDGPQSPDALGYIDLSVFTLGKTAIYLPMMERYFVAERFYWLSFPHKHA